MAAVPAQLPDLALEPAHGPGVNVPLAAPLMPPLPLAPALAPPVRVTSFAQLYGDESKDPCNRRYERIMTRFDAAQLNAPASAELLQQVVSLGENTLQAYLFCANTAVEPRIYCAHAPSRFVSSLEGITTPWDNKSFAFLGDLVQNLILTIQFPDHAIEEITVHAKAVDYMLQNLDELAGHPVFVPVDPTLNDPTVQEITTRRFMYLPAAYVPLFLSASGYSVRQTWNLLYPALQQRHELVTCAPLLRWLQAASMGTQEQPMQIAPPSVSILMVAPPADESLLAQRNRILHTLLPGLSAPPQTLELALNHMAAALIAQMNDTRQARDQKAALEQEPKLPSSRFMVMLPVLLEYLQIPTEDDLPDLWHRWANCTKKQEVQVLRDVLDGYARSADAFSPLVPIVTPRLVQDLLSFTFLGQSANDIRTGLHPFIITDGNAEFRQTNAEIARLYGLINAGDATCSLADLETLTAKEVRSVPLSYWELEKSLGMFGNLVGVVLGATHPLTASFRDFWKLLQTNVKEDLHAALEYKAFVKPAHILRSLQLTFYTWFAHKRAHLTPPTPDMKTIVHQIVMQVYILPHLPPQLYQLAYPKKPSLPGAASVSSGSTPHTSTTGSSSYASSAASSNGSMSGGSTISGLTVPTLPPPQTRGSAVFNLTLNATLQQLLPTNIKLKDLIGTLMPPSFESGGEMCLSYLVRNTCWTNCRRAAGHRGTLTPQEQQRLEQYITAQKQVYAAKRQHATSAATTGSG
jgi:hypothetical protein